MAAYALPALLAFAINMSLVIILLLDAPKSHTHRLFALLIFCFALWDIADIIVITSTTAEAASVGGMIIVPALLFASAFYLVLSFSFPRSIHSRFDRLLIRPLFLVLPLFFSILAGLGIFQPLELHRFAAQQAYCYVANTSGGILDVAMYAVVFVYLVWGIRNLTRQMGSSSLVRERRQITYMLAGTVAFALLVILLDVLREHEEFHFYASRALYLLISLSFAHVVLGNRVVILRQLGRRGLAYSLLTGLVFAFYLFVIKNIAGMLGKQFDISSVVLEALLILALAFAFRPLLVRIQSLVEYLLRQSAFRRRQEFLQLSREMFHLTDMPGLARAVAAFAERSLLATGAELLSAETSSGVLRNALRGHEILSLEGALGRLRNTEEKACPTAELLKDCTGGEREILERFEGGYVIPLRGKADVIGVLLLGRKRMARYTPDDEEFLPVLANEVANAVERNMLMERMRAEELRAAQSEKLAALGQLTAGIAHEFRNPLNIIATSAQTILRNPGNSTLHEEAGRYILEETRRLNRTVDDFLQFAKSHTPAWQHVDLHEVIDGVIGNMTQQSSTSGIRIRSEIREPLPGVTTSPRHVERALMNLGLNAVEAMQAGGDLTFAACRNGEHVTLSVRDTGPGIAPELQKKIFDPFVTTKPGGTGLGLPIVYMMVQSIGGEMSFVSGSGGTTFTITLPITPDRQ